MVEGRSEGTRRGRVKREKNKMKGKSSKKRYGVKVELNQWEDKLRKEDGREEEIEEWERVQMGGHQQNQDSGGAWGESIREVCVCQKGIER